MATSSPLQPDPQEDEERGNFEYTTSNYIKIMVLITLMLVDVD